MNKKVYGANLPFQTSELELKVLFSKPGDVMSVKIVADRQTDHPKCLELMFIYVSGLMISNRKSSNTEACLC